MVSIVLVKFTVEFYFIHKITKFTNYLFTKLLKFIYKFIYKILFTKLQNLPIIYELFIYKIYIHIFYKFTFIKFLQIYIYKILFTKIQNLQIIYKIL